jgi:hypothetical protein
MSMAGEGAIGGRTAAFTAFPLHFHRHRTPIAVAQAVAKTHSNGHVFMRQLR